MGVGSGGEFLETGSQTFPERLQIELLAETRQNAGEELVELGGGGSGSGVRGTGSRSVNLA